MMYREADVFSQLHGVVDGVLYHEREIIVNVDDSVVMFTGLPKQHQLIRRSRGFVPEAIPLPRKLDKKVLCFGAQQKNTFCFGFGNKAILSQHNGDLDTQEAQEAFEHALQHMKRVFAFEPELIVCDMHPEYASSRYARRLAENRHLPLIEVQHHEAHAFSVADAHAEVQGPVLAVSFDGTGYGTDGNIWGGEFFQIVNCNLKIANLNLDSQNVLADTDTVDSDSAGMIERVAHFDYVSMPGGDYAVKEPYRMMLAHLWKTFGDRSIDEYFRDSVANQTFRGVWELVKRGGHVQTSSVGRLFDAISALLTGRYVTSYEGQAAMELETLARSGNKRVKALECEIHEKSGQIHINTDPLFETVIKRLAGQSNPADLALAFHKSIARVIVRVAERMNEKCALVGVSLSGGVFQNTLLVSLASEALHKAGFKVYLPGSVPVNDGGISFGQLLYVLARDMDRL